MILSKFLNQILIFNWMDFIEIAFFSLIFYSFSLWLKADKQKNLILQFYSVLALCIGSHFLGLSTINYFLLSFLPCIFMIFILIHQNNLQKNFVALKKFTPTQVASDLDWIDNFMRSCFLAMNNNKQIICVIENNDQLNEFVFSDLMIASTLKKELLDILIDSPSFDSQKMIWINCDGKLQAINSNWNIKNNTLWVAQNTQKVDEWQQEAIIFTSKLDALAFKICPSTRLFDIAIQGNLMEKISPNNALQVITQYVRKNKIQTLKKGKNEIQFNKSSSEQPMA